MQYVNIKNTLFFILLILFVKFVIAFGVIYLDWFQGFVDQGGDANSYHSHAIGAINWSDNPNLWFIILRYLNEIGLYNRGFFTFFNVFLGCILIPYMVSISSSGDNKKNIYLCFLISSSFYSLFFYSVDIYRDPIMILTFIIGLIFLKNTKGIVNISLAFLTSWILFLFRDYLGVSFFLAFIIVYIFKIDFLKFNPYIFIFSYVVFLNLLFLLGFFDDLIKYRTWFFENDAGTNLKQDFSNKNIFIYNFLSSFFIQFFGFYFINFKTFALFLLESIPFIYSLYYFFKNRKYRNNFVIFLISFCVIYGTLVAIGNGNFGTALRLRLFVYFSILIAAFQIYQIKVKSHNVEK